MGRGFMARLDVIRGIVLAMAAQTQQMRHHQLRPLPVARPRSTASRSTFRHAVKSLPSTECPRTPYPAALSTRSLQANCREVGVE